MKIACCQFAPEWCQVEHNMSVCDHLLEEYTAGDMDVLILPEMAFTGYVFHNLKEIEPYLEDAETGPSVRWAKKQAMRLQCFVLVGYPQKQGDTNYNSQCCVNPQGEVVSTYQKTFLYETDANWAAEGPDFVSLQLDSLGKVGFGICMDLNPKAFKADFEAYEFANFHVKQKTEILLCSMAWLKSKSDTESSLSTIKYWMMRLLPLYKKAKPGQRTIFAACNRIGNERGSEFAGNSCVFEVSDDGFDIIDYMKQNTGIMIANIDE